MKFLRPTCLAGVLLALACGAAGCGKKPAADVLARVGDQVITVADFKAEYQRRLDLHQPLPDRRTLLEQMVERETRLQQARAAGLQNDVEVRRAAEDALIRKFEETRVAPQIAAVKVAPEEIQAAYDRDVARYTQPAKVKLGILHFAVDAKADTNQLAIVATRAQEVRLKATALPADVRGFGSLAADYSDDQLTRYRGGDAGWFADDGLATRWPKEILAAGFTLKTNGELSAVLRGPDGFYVVKKLDARPASVTPLAQMRPVIERRLLAEKRQAVAQQLSAAARAVAQVSTDAARLATVDYPQSSAGASAPAVLPALSANP